RSKRDWSSDVCSSDLLRDPGTAYVSYRDLEEGGIKWLGVAKTTDAGRNWQLVWKEDSNPVARPATNIHDAWITERFGSDWGENQIGRASCRDSVIHVL